MKVLPLSSLTRVDGPDFDCTDITTILLEEGGEREEQREREIPIVLTCPASFPLSICFLYLPPTPG